MNIERMEVYSKSILAMYYFLHNAPEAFKSAWKLYLTTNGTGQPENGSCESMSRSVTGLPGICLSNSVSSGFMHRGTAAHEHNQSGGMQRLHWTKKNSTGYVEKLAALCQSSQKAKQVWDKPNVHRLLKLLSFK